MCSPSGSVSQRMLGSTRARPGIEPGKSLVLWSCPSRRRLQRGSSREGGKVVQRKREREKEKRRRRRRREIEREIEVIEHSMRRF